MIFLRLVVIFCVTVAVTVTLNTKIGNIPPLGKLFDPIHGFWQNSERVPGNMNKKIFALKGLKRNVEVKYDSFLIPHIFAENNHDLYFMQGYITARHRLWQMEFLTYIAGGRLSEIIGEKGLAFDRLQRRKGLAWSAQKALEEIKKDSALFSLVQTYVEGVNAYIASLNTKRLPVEYKLLNYKPQEWTPLKSILISKLMADDLAGWDCDFENTNALNFLGLAHFDLLFPERPHNIDPIIPTGTKWNFEPLQHTKTYDGYNAYTDFLKTATSKPHPANGSNNWVVNGKKSKTKKPILANDTHLGLNLPSTWFLNQLQSPDVNVYGATIPGLLGIIVGFNDSIAWGVTNAKRDVKDWYKITFKENQNTRYLYDGEWVPTKKTVEEIKIRGEESFYDTVYYTRHGPVVYDHSFTKNEEKLNFALRWTVHDPSIEQKAILLINKAKNYDHFSQALQHFHSPAQNFAFASTQGDIALWVQGKFPLKWKNQGKFILDGSKPEHEWEGFIPQSHNAHVINPEQGFVSSANQFPVDSTYPYYTYDGHYEAYRNRRINQKLSKMEQISPEDMMQLQNDNYSLKATEVLPLLLAYLNTNNLAPEHLEAYRELEQWNFYNDADQKAPSIFYLWWENFHSLLWDEFDRDDRVLIKPSDNTTISLLANNDINKFADIQHTGKKESVRDLIQTSFINSLDSLKRWSVLHQEDYLWGKFKGTKIQHIATIDAFSISDIEVSGSRHSINANSRRHGASLRIVVSLEDKVKAWGIYPGGQSGNPGSLHYDNFVAKWRKGEFIPLLFIQDKKEQGAGILFSQRFQSTD